MNQMISKSQPLHIQAYHILKKSIIEGEFEPEERITEVKFAEKFGISRGPIREVIRMLIQDGLLVQKDGPVRVFQPTTDDVIEVFQCREYLEALATRLTANKMNDEIKEELLLNIEQTKVAIEQKQTAELSRLDQQFHELIIEASGNQHLIQLSNVIQAKVSYMRNRILSGFYQHFVDTVDEHYRIFQAITNHDGAQAEAEMRLHIKKAVDVFTHLVK